MAKMGIVAGDEYSWDQSRLRERALTLAVEIGGWSDTTSADDIVSIAYKFFGFLTNKGDSNNG